MSLPAARRAAEGGTVGAAAWVSGAGASLSSIEARNAVSISTSTEGSGSVASSGLAATSARKEPVAAVHCGFGGAATNTAFRSVVSGLNSSAASGMTASSGSASSVPAAAGSPASGSSGGAGGGCADGVGVGAGAAAVPAAGSASAAWRSDRRARALKTLEQRPQRT